MNDDRNYIYEDKFDIRAEYPIICDWVKDGSKVIDLGCGNGSLMKYLLERKKNLTIEGIEISDTGVEIGRRHGLNIKRGSIDDKNTFSDYGDNQFDYSICNATFSMVMYPEVLLKEMKRISKYQIISFPNFAYILNRLELMFLGRMPRIQLYGYKWYNTGHIHQLSIKDFKEVTKEYDLKIVKEVYLGGIYKIFKILPNLFSREGLFLCSK